MEPVSPTDLAACLRVLARLAQDPTDAALAPVRPAVDLATFVGAWVRRARPVIDPRWRTADVRGVARGIAADQALDRLPLLADALMDAGCEDDHVLAACRSAAPAGWWLVDLVLGGG